MDCSKHGVDGDDMIELVRTQNWLSKNMMYYLINLLGACYFFVGLSLTAWGPYWIEPISWTELIKFVGYFVLQGLFLLSGLALIFVSRRFPS